MTRTPLKWLLVGHGVCDLCGLSEPHGHLLRADGSLGSIVQSWESLQATWAPGRPGDDTFNNDVELLLAGLEVKSIAELKRIVDDYPVVLRELCECEDVMFSPELRAFLRARGMAEALHERVGDL